MGNTNKKRNKHQNTSYAAVQCFSRRKDELSKRCWNDMKAELKKRMGKKIRKMYSDIMDDVSSIDKAEPVLVLCISSTRLGTDAVYACADLSSPRKSRENQRFISLPKHCIIVTVVTVGDPVATFSSRCKVFALVILHCCEETALPTVSSKEILWQYQSSFGDIIDLAYQPNKKFYQCDMNNTSLPKIVDFILDSKFQAQENNRAITIPAQVMTSSTTSTSNTSTKKLDIGDGAACKVQCYSRRNDELSEKCWKDMKVEFGKRMDKKYQKYLNLDIKNDVSSIDTGVPVLVLCFNTTTLRTDADNALAELSSLPPDKHVLICLHCCGVPALPKVSSKAVLFEDQYQSLGGIFDLAYEADKGFYPCAMNTNSFPDIVKFVKNPRHIQAFQNPGRDEGTAV